MHIVRLKVLNPPRPDPLGDAASRCKCYDRGALRRASLLSDRQPDPPPKSRHHEKHAYSIASISPAESPDRFLLRVKPKPTKNPNSHDSCLQQMATDYQWNNKGVSARSRSRAKDPEERPSSLPGQRPKRLA